MNAPFDWALTAYVNHIGSNRRFDALRVQSDGELLLYDLASRRSIDDRLFGETILQLEVWDMTGISVSGFVPVKIEPTAVCDLGRRINLILPHVGKGTEFGGIACALRLFEQLGPRFGSMRMISLLQDEAEIDESDLDGWPLEGTKVARRCVAFPCSEGRALRVHAEDFFVATASFTASYAKEVVLRQASLFSLVGRKFVYFIQEYEPAFYPWSVHYVRAKQTYTDKERVIVVFNSRSLAGYFRGVGLHFDHEFVFEPRLHPVLKRARADRAGVSKKRQILIYARPALARNAFALIVEGVRMWAASYPLATSWVVLSAGDPHQDIPLDNGVCIRSLGKLDINGYAACLMETWIGIAFSLLPHPGYPRLEMAEFGAWVITNPFEGRDFSDLSPAICAVEDLTAEAIAARLRWCCEQYRPGSTEAVTGAASVFPDGEEFPYDEALLHSWM